MKIGIYPIDAFAGSATLLFLFLSGQHHTLAKALLANCSITEKPGIVTFGTTDCSPFTFDLNILGNERYGGVLGAAAACCHVQLVRQLLHLGAEVDLSDKDMCNHLIVAARSGNKGASSKLYFKMAQMLTRRTKAILL